MTTTDPDRITDAQLKTQTRIPPTRGAELRETLKTLEKRLAKLADSSPNAALEILTLFDKIEVTADQLSDRGMDLSSELGQIDTLTAQFLKKRALFIRKIGGSQILAEARRSRQPSPDQWWWHIDQSLAAEKKRRTLIMIRNLGITAVLFIIAALVYQRFLAPDPAFQASYGLQQITESAIIEGDYETALQNVQDALLHTPDNPELYVLQGVILKELGKDQDAQASFEIAYPKFETEDLFHNTRAMVYLLMGNFQNVLSDSDIALEINPDSAIAYLNKAQAYEAQGDIIKAIECFEQADEIAQKLGDVQLQAIIRVSLTNAYQRMPLPSVEPGEMVEPTP